jgi:hypothetical protein
MSKHTLKVDEQHLACVFSYPLCYPTLIEMIETIAMACYLMLSADHV